jgi:hypothetical protein
MELISYIVSRVDCNLPPELVKEYTNTETQFVNTSWIGFNELDMANRIIKLALWNISEGHLNSNLIDVPALDCWKYAGFEYKNGLPSYVVDYPYVPIATGEIRNICSDGFATLGNFAVKHGKFPKSVLFSLPERVRPPWRDMKELICNPVISIEDYELSLPNSPDYSDWRAIGIQVIEGIEEKSIPKEPDKQLEHDVFEDTEYVMTKKYFTTEDWQSLYLVPSSRMYYYDEDCDIHAEHRMDANSIPKRDCLACKIYSENPHNLECTGHDRELEERSRGWASLEQLLAALGYTESNEVDLFGSGSEDGEGGMFDFM